VPGSGSALIHEGRSFISSDINGRYLKFGMALGMAFLTHCDEKLIFIIPRGLEFLHRFYEVVLPVMNL
jgi:hypothetical protein